GIICVQGYKVKNVFAPILEAIFKKHGDIAARKIQTNDVTNIIFGIDEIKSQVYTAEAANFNVSWLRVSLNDIHKRNEAGKKFGEAERCEEVLKLVEKELNIDVLDSKAEKDLWAQKPVI
ncbi:hypothetical protein Tco_0373005, partial [Tanacetum coccineum]